MANKIKLNKEIIEMIENEFQDKDYIVIDFYNDNAIRKVLYNCLTGGSTVIDTYAGQIKQGNFITTSQYFIENDHAQKYINKLKAIIEKYDKDLIGYVYVD